MDDATQLLLQAGRGDRDALSRFVAATQADVWRYCASMLNRSDAEDATQETFVRAWRSAPQFRGEATARTWVLSIARRVCLQLVGRQVRADRERDSAEEVGRARSIPGGDPSEAIVLSRLIGYLPVDQRAAFVLTQLLGLSYEESAQVIGCPIGTIRSRVARARRDLQQLVAEAEGGSGPSRFRAWVRPRPG
jgi:RNA polymerase sigma-70 factor, ECF subfamily